MVDKYIQEQYNNALARYKKAEKFFNAENVPLEQKERFFNEFNKVVRALSLMMKDFKTLYGREMTDKEINEGF